MAIADRLRIGSAIYLLNLLSSVDSKLTPTPDPLRKIRREVMRKNAEGRANRVLA